MSFSVVRSYSKTEKTYEEFPLFLLESDDLKYRMKKKGLMAATIRRLMLYSTIPLSEIIHT